MAKHLGVFNSWRHVCTCAGTKSRSATNDKLDKVRRESLPKGRVGTSQGDDGWSAWGGELVVTN